MVGVVSSSRAISRVPNPSAASSTIRILSNCRCSVVAARSRDSNTARSFGFSRTSIASGIISLLNHDAEHDDSANVTQSLQIPGTSSYPFFSWRFRSRTLGPPPFSSMNSESQPW